MHRKHDALLILALVATCVLVFLVWSRGTDAPVAIVEADEQLRDALADGPARTEPRWTVEEGFEDPGPDFGRRPGAPLSSEPPDRDLPGSLGRGYGFAPPGACR